MDLSVEALVSHDCERQGLPIHVTDPDALRRIAAIVKALRD